VLSGVKTLAKVTLREQTLQRTCSTLLLCLNLWCGVSLSVSLQRNWILWIISKMCMKSAEMSISMLLVREMESFKSTHLFKNWPKSSTIRGIYNAFLKIRKMHFLKIQNLKLQKVETCLRNFVTEKKQVLGYCRNSQNTPLVVLQGSLYNLTNISARGFTDIWVEIWSSDELSRIWCARFVHEN